MPRSQRLISLTPHATDILCTLGLAERLVAISPHCDAPPTAPDLPRLTLDSAQLRTLAPDLLVTAGPDIPTGWPEAEVLALHPLYLQDIWDDIHRLGAATGQQRQAATLLEGLFARVNTLVAETIRLPAIPRVVLLVDLSPLRLGGAWLPDLVQLAGGRAGLSRPGEAAREVTWEQVCAYAPEVMLLSPVGMALAAMPAALATLQALPGWDTLPAVQAGHVIGIDHRAGLHRPGPRIVESIALLAGLLHPDLFGEHLEAAEGLYRYLLP